MGPLLSLLQVAPNDPLMLAGLLVAVWMPVCAAGLFLLWALAQTNEIFAHRRKPRPGLMLPPPEVRPLAARRYLTVAEHAGADSGSAIGAFRVMLAVIAVAGLTVFALGATGRLLLAAMGR